MSEKSFEGKVIISPTPERKPSTYFSSYQSNNNLSIGTYLSRSTNYTITIKGDVRDQYGVPLGEDYTFSFKTAPFKPSVSIVPAATKASTLYYNVCFNIEKQESCEAQPRSMLVWPITNVECISNDACQNNEKCFNFKCKELSCKSKITRIAVFRRS